MNIRPNPLSEFYRTLKQHDWFAVMSDDQEVWRRSREQERSFTEEANGNFLKNRALSGFHKWRAYAIAHPGKPLPDVEQFMPDEVIDALGDLENV